MSVIIKFFLLFSICYFSSFSTCLAFGQGLNLIIHSYLPHTAVSITQNQCVDYSDTTIPIGETAYLKANNNLIHCAAYSSYINFSIVDTTTHTTLASYQLTISATGSEVKNTFLNSAYAQDAILYPHSGLYTGSTDLVMIALANDESHWMGSLGDQVANKQLNQLFLPGTHDAGTYAITPSSPLMADAKKPIIALYYSTSTDIVGVTQAAVRNFLKGWALSQQKNTLDQLKSGVRYFDLRLCGDGPSLDKMYLCHALQGDSFINVVSAIKTFLSQPEHQKEIIIVDINHWYNYQTAALPAMEENALSYISMQLSPWIAPKKSADGRILFAATDTVNKFWNNNTSLIIASNEIPSKPNFNFVWKSINSENLSDCLQPTDICSFWPNKNNPTDLKRSITETLSFVSRSLPPATLFVLQTQETESPSDLSLSAIPITPSAGTLLAFTATYKNEIVSFLTDPDNNEIYRLSGGFIVLEDFSNGIDLVELSKKLLTTMNSRR